MYLFYTFNYAFKTYVDSIVTLVFEANFHWKNVSIRKTQTIYLPDISFRSIWLFGEFDLMLVTSLNA